ncbi:MAG: bi-domain-containing oxidoreductase [Acidimicrobiales bacterium]
MRQVLLSSQGAIVARMPRPALAPGSVLIRTHFSLISTGTELAALAPTVSVSSLVSRPDLAFSTAKDLLAKAMADPAKARRRVATLVTGRVRAALPARPVSREAVTVGSLRWQAVGRAKCQVSGEGLTLFTDGEANAYQVQTDAIEIPVGHVPVLHLEGVTDGRLTVGMLSGSGSSWLGTALVGPGDFDEQLEWDPGSDTQIRLVLADSGEGVACSVHVNRIRLETLPRASEGPSEMSQQGWASGYSMAGVVVAVGAGVEDLVPGDRVACAGAGDANHADYVCVPRNLVCPVPAGCDLSHAATTTVGSIALQGVRRAAPQLGERVCVLGLGLIGQITVQLLKAGGAHVIGFDPDQQRVDRAVRLGLDFGAIDPQVLAREVAAATGGHGVDRTLITAATKSDDPVNLAMDLTRAKGTVVVVGDVGLGVKRALFYRKEIDLLMSTSYGPGRYDAQYEREGHDYPYAYVRWTLNRNMASYLDLVSRGQLRVAPLIDRVTSVDEAAEVYRLLASGSGSKPLGVLLRYVSEAADREPTPLARSEAEQGCDVAGDNKNSRPVDPFGVAARTDETVSLGGARHRRPGASRYALVGAGAFATGMLVPQLKRRPDRFSLAAVVSRDTARGGNLARQERVSLLATDLGSVLADPKIDLVVIATRHHEHAGQVVASLEAGKHVFVEKPLALTWEQLARVAEAHEATRNSLAPLLMVGFNRRFSPALVTLARELVGRRAPLVVSYRVNAGWLPADHWTQGPQGGGRNLGEACHMYDVIRFLAGSPARSITASGISPGGSGHRRNDNFSATIGYEDGSLGTLIYTASGPNSASIGAGMGKERIEVFCDGRAWVVDDFRSLTRCDDGNVLWRSAEAEKGHYQEMGFLGDAIRASGPAPIPFSELMETSAVALHVEDLLREG